MKEQSSEESNVVKELLTEVHVHILKEQVNERTEAITDIIKTGGYKKTLYMTFLFFSFLIT